MVVLVISSTVEYGQDERAAEAGMDPGTRQWTRRENLALQEEEEAVNGECR